jgi:CheY-like chemotaxis protein
MKKNKILMIIDDSEDDRYFFIEAIKEIDKNFEYYVANNGLEGLNHLRNTKPLPDFIFLDVKMPVMNGKECLKELKKDGDLKKIPVVIYTSSLPNQHKDLTRTQGVAQFLTKVYDHSKLSSAIYEVISTIEHNIRL